MKLSSVLAHIAPVRGFTSVIAVFVVLVRIRESAGLHTSLGEARKQVADYDRLIKSCKSDAAYWGYLGQREYWQMVANVLEAATLTGPNNLPDVNWPDRDGMVMDLIGQQKRFGEEVLRQAKLARPEAGEEPR